MKRMKMMLIALGLGGVLVGVPLTALAASPGSGGASTGRAAGVIRYIASVEGVSPTVLRQDLKAGETLLQIAGSKYASADDLATALLARFKTKIRTAVAAGRVSAGQAQTTYNRMHARVAQLVVTPHPKLGTLKGGKAVHGLRRTLLQTFASTCNTTSTALKAAVQAGGQTPLAICQATNSAITQDALVSALMSGIKSTLDAAATSHPRLAQHESQILGRIQNRLNTWVTTPIPAHS